MPRARKPARLYQRPDDGAWLIRDGSRTLRTGARGDSGRRAAEEALARYVASRAPERRGPAMPDEITIGEVLALYARERAPQLSSRERAGYAIKALSPFWGDLTCNTVTGATCRRYATARGASDGTVRRELATLQAALSFAHREGLLIYPVAVTLPPRPLDRERWFSRGELASILRESPTPLRRLILLGAGTGTRVSALLKLRWVPSIETGWIDLEAGVLHRRGAGERETTKRRGSVKLTRRLLSHCRRWQRSGGERVVGYASKDTARQAFNRACARAGVKDARLHDLKRTAVTIAFQNGMSREDAQEYFSTSAAILERAYRQHSPEYQDRAVNIMERRQR